MCKRKLAFTVPSGLGVSNFSMTRASTFCQSSKPILPLIRKPSYHHTQHVTNVFASGNAPSITVEPILEGDLVAYRDRASPVWSLGAVTDTPKPDQYHVRSLYSRTSAEDGIVECFVDWEPHALALTIASDTHEITLVEADYEERVVQNRLENPHGEVSEDCWRMSTQLLDSIGVTIRAQNTL